MKGLAVVIGIDEDAIDHGAPVFDVSFDEPAAGALEAFENSGADKIVDAEGDLFTVAFD